MIQREHDNGVTVLPLDYGKANAHGRHRLPRSGHPRAPVVG